MDPKYTKYVGMIRPGAGHPEWSSFMNTGSSPRRSYGVPIAFIIGAMFAIWCLWFQSWALKGIRPSADLRHHIIIAEHFCMRRIEKLKIDFGLPRKSLEDECRMKPIIQDVTAPLEYTLTSGVTLIVKLKLNFLSPSEVGAAYIRDDRPSKRQNIDLLR
jgi:hypothetical protein